jgi:hypothetical protein
MIKTWLELYRESSENDKKTDEWKKGMLKIISVLSINEDLENTPFKEKIEESINLAKKNDLNQLQIICEKLDEVNNYFQEN